MAEVSLSIYFVYVLFFIILWFIFVFKDFKKDARNYMLFVVIGMVGLFLADNFTIITKIYTYYLPYQIPFLKWAPLVMPLHFIYSSAVFRFSKLAKSRKSFFLYSFVFGALFGLVLDSSGTALSFWEYNSNSSLAWFNNVLAIELINMPLLAVITEGIFFLLLIYLATLIKKDFVKYKR